MANIIYTNYFEKIDLFQRLKKEGRIVNTPFRNTVSENSFCFEIGMKPSNTEEYRERLLQTIKDVFGITNSSFDKKFKHFGDYEDIHKQLVDALEEIESQPQTFKVGKNILTYQGVFRNYNLDERVRELYDL